MWGVPTSKGTPLQKGTAGAVAVIPEVLTITTLELAKIGLQLDKDKKYSNSITKLVKDVYARNGLAGCMVGWQGVQLRQSLWTGTYFATLDYFKKSSDKIVSSFIPEKPKRAGLVDFLAGFFAGVAGAMANTPVDVIRTNIQKAALGPNPPAGPVAMAVSLGPLIKLGSEIVAAKGVAGLYAGFAFKALHMGGSGAVSSRASGFVGQIICHFRESFLTTSLSLARPR